MNLTSSARVDRRLSLLRWNLHPSAAALWQLASQRICQDLNIHASWIEIDQHWDPVAKCVPTKLSIFEESNVNCRVSAFIVGIERSNLGYIASIARHLRECCHRSAFEAATHGAPTASSTCLIAWFPQADRESMQILREIGFDLVLHNPSSLRSVLAKIAQPAAG